MILKTQPNFCNNNSNVTKTLFRFFFFFKSPIVQKLLGIHPIWTPTEWPNPLWTLVNKSGHGVTVLPLSLRKKKKTKRLVKKEVCYVLEIFPPKSNCETIDQGQPPISRLCCRPLPPAGAADRRKVLPPAAACSPEICLKFGSFRPCRY